MTYLEQEKSRVKPGSDADLPSRKDDIGASIICPLWNFNRKTEKGKHYTFFHPRTQRTDQPASTSSEKLRCNFEVNRKKCGLNFTSYRQLDKHKMKHKKAKNM